MLGLSFEVRQLPGYFGLRNRLGLGWMVSSCAPTTTTMVPKATPNRNENILFLLVIWLKSLIILWKHNGQDWLTVITGADVGDDLDGFLASRSHQKVDLEGDPVRVHGSPGSKQRQNHQIMESADDRLPLTFETIGNFDIAMEQVIGDHGVELEADSLRSFGDVYQHTIGNRLLPGIGINNVPAVISRHFQHLPEFDQATVRALPGSSQ